MLLPSFNVLFFNLCVISKGVLGIGLDKQNIGWKTLNTCLIDADVSVSVCTPKKIAIFFYV